MLINLFLNYQFEKIRYSTYRWTKIKDTKINEISLKIDLKLLTKLRETPTITQTNYKSLML